MYLQFVKHVNMYFEKPDLSKLSWNWDRTNATYCTALWYSEYWSFNYSSRLRISIRKSFWHWFLLQHYFINIPVGGSRKSDPSFFFYFFFRHDYYLLLKQRCVLEFFSSCLCSRFSLVSLLYSTVHLLYLTMNGQ